eukprot:995625-Pyramimonas_sp.AAC.1
MPLTLLGIIYHPVLCRSIAALVGRREESWLMGIVQSSQNYYMTMGQRLWDLEVAWRLFHHELAARQRQTDAWSMTGLDFPARYGRAVDSSTSDSDDSSTAVGANMRAHMLGRL